MSPLPLPPKHGTIPKLFPQDNPEYLPVPVRRFQKTTSPSRLHAQAGRHSPPFRTPPYAPILSRACDPWPRSLLGLVVRFRFFFPVCADSHGLCSPFGPAEAQPRLQCSPPPFRSIPSGANLLRSRGRPFMRRLAVGVQGRGAGALKGSLPLVGPLVWLLPSPHGDAGRRGSAG